MAKVEKKLLFTEIRKSVGNITFRTRKNRVIDISKKKKPHHPNTPAQLRNKWKYGYLVQKFNQLTSEEREYYETLAKKDNLTAWNAYVKANFHQSGEIHELEKTNQQWDLDDKCSPWGAQNEPFLYKDSGYEAFFAVMFNNTEIQPKSIIKEAYITFHVYDNELDDTANNRIRLYPIIQDIDIANATCYYYIPYRQDIYAEKAISSTDTVIQVDLVNLLQQVVNDGQNFYGFMVMLEVDTLVFSNYIYFDGLGYADDINVYVSWEW